MNSEKSKTKRKLKKTSLKRLHNMSFQVLVFTPNREYRNERKTNIFKVAAPKRDVKHEFSSAYIQYQVSRALFSNQKTF